MLSLITFMFIWLTSKTTGFTNSGMKLVLSWNLVYHNGCPPNGMYDFINPSSDESDWKSCFSETSIKSFLRVLKFSCSWFVVEPLCWWDWEKSGRPSNLMFPSFRSSANEIDFCVWSRISDVCGFMFGSAEIKNSSCGSSTTPYKNADRYCGLTTWRIIRDTCSHGYGWKQYDKGSEFHKD